MEDEEGGSPAEPFRRKAAHNASIIISKKGNSCIRRVSSILRKKEERRSEEDKRFLEKNPEEVEDFLKRRERRVVWQSRQFEQEDSEEELKVKCKKLAQAIHDAEFLVVYTGAGISTAASIPDYRGPNGIWTLMQKGIDIGNHDLSAAEPTATHMAIADLYQQGTVRHVVSQNCDGLHLRSGLPKTAMSEVHGNMYIEACRHCVPAREYVRTFDVTENTSTHKHATGRRCYRCGEPLIDTIVHFGERGKLRWPLNWQGACQAAKACDAVLCLGSSLKVLRKYPWLWQMDRPPKKRPELYIVNLQWTPKDKDATLKINGKCDIVMNLVMKELGLSITPYWRCNDPIFQIATPLHQAELNTTTRPHLVQPSLKQEEVKEEVTAKEEAQEIVTVKQECQEKRSNVKVNRKLQSSTQILIPLGNPDLLKVELKEEVESKDGECEGIKDEGVSEVKEEGESGIKEERDMLNFSKEGLQINDVKLEQEYNSECGDIKEYAEELWMSNSDYEVKSEVKDENEEEENEEEEIEEEEEDNDEEEDENIAQENLTELLNTGDTECQSDLDSMSSSLMDDEKDYSSDELSESEQFMTTENSDEHLMEDNLLQQDVVVTDDRFSYSVSDGENDVTENCLDDQNVIENQIVERDGGSNRRPHSKSEEDSDWEGNEERRKKENINNYFKMAYCSSGGDIQQERQVRLLQKEFYGTGLCIRSVKDSKPARRRSSDKKTVASNSKVSFQNEPDISKDGDLNSSDLRQTQLLSEADQYGKDSSYIYKHMSPLQGLASSNNVDCLPGVKASPVMCSAIGSLGQSIQERITQPENQSEALMTLCQETEALTKVDIDVITQVAQCDTRPTSIVKLAVQSGGVERVGTPPHDYCKMVREVSDVNQVSEEEIDRNRISLLQNRSVTDISTDHSFLLRTQIVNGVIKTASVEPIGSENKSDGFLKREIVQGVGLKAEVSDSVNIASGNMKSHNNHLTKLNVGNAISKKLQSKGVCKVNLSIDDCESDELKSIWYQSFCGNDKDQSEASCKSSSSNLGFNYKCCANNSSNNLLRHICDEMVNNNKVHKKGTQNCNTQNSDDHDIKCLWFWGFDSNAADNVNKKDENPVADGYPKQLEAVTESQDSDDAVRPRRITRSSTRASAESKSGTGDESSNPETPRCNCAGYNPELCRAAAAASNKMAPDSEVERARDVFQRKRILNYRRFEPEFKVQLQSYTYERRKAKRKAKIDVGESEEEVEEEEHDFDHILNENFESTENKDWEEKRCNPGWYGKGYRKGIKRKSR